MFSHLCLCDLGHLRLASISRLMGNPAAALEILSRVSTTNNSRDFNLVRGDVLLLMGRTEEAKRSYEMGIDNVRESAVVSKPSFHTQFIQLRF